MSKVAIVTDSTAYIPLEYRQNHNITSVPLQVIWGQDTYRDGIDIQPAEFYQRLTTSKTMPTTSQPSAAVMQKAFGELLEQGYEVLGLFISSKLSGTYQSATQGRELLTQGQDKVTILDSETASMALGFQVLTVARAAEQGASLQECQKLAGEAMKTTGIYFMVDTLEFLHRGGRIGGAQRFLGTALNLKPILAVRNGKVEAVERIRTKGKALERVLDLVAEQCKGKKPARLATIHANIQAEAKTMLEEAASRIGAEETILSEISPVVGTHTGPGTLGLAYMAGM